MNDKAVSGYYSAESLHSGSDCLEDYGKWTPSLLILFMLGRPYRNCGPSVN